MYTRPHHEKKVAAQLDRLQIGNYLPLARRISIWSDRRKIVDAPLFPSYLFVWVNDVQSYYSSLEVSGILYYVRNGKDFVPIKDSVISSLKMMIGNFPDKLEVTSSGICPGEPLLIREGPFTGFCCEVVRIDGVQKMLVRIEMLHRNVLLNIPIDHLMPAHSLIGYL